MPSDNVPANLPPPHGDLPTDPMMNLLERALSDPNFNPANFAVAVEFLREREKTAAHRAFNDAMLKAAGEMQAVPKDAANDYLRSRYANLPGMLSVIKPITAQNGLAFRFGTLPHADPDWMTVTCILSLGNHVETTALSGPILSGEGTRGGKTEMNPLQAVGGTVTYLERYLLGMVFSLIQHMPDILADNDGGDPTQGQRTYKQSPPSQPPYQAPPGRPQDAPTMAKTNGSGNGANIDAMAVSDRVKRFLAKVSEQANAATTFAALNEVESKATAATTGWPLTVTAAIAVMIKTNRDRIALAVSQQAAANARVEATDEADEVVLAPETQALLDEVGSMDEAALAGVTEPAFAQRLLALSMLDQLLVDDAIKARGAELDMPPRMTEVSDIQERLRQQNEPQAKVQPLERMIEAMILVSTIDRKAGDAFRFALLVAIVAAPYGPLGGHTKRHLEQVLERLDRHSASLEQPPPKEAA